MNCLWNVKIIYNHRVLLLLEICCGPVSETPFIIYNHPVLLLPEICCGPVSETPFLSSVPHTMYNVRRNVIIKFLVFNYSDYISRIE